MGSKTEQQKIIEAYAYFSNRTSNIDRLAATALLKDLDRMPICVYKDNELDKLYCANCNGQLKMKHPWNYNPAMNKRCPKCGQKQAFSKLRRYEFMEHDLKILPEYFEPVLEGKKNFELRKNDRDYKVGDTLLLREWYANEYTGREVRRKVTYILEKAVGIDTRYVILAMEEE